MPLSFHSTLTLVLGTRGADVALDDVVLGTNMLGKVEMMRLWREEMRGFSKPQVMEVRFSARAGGPE